MKPLSEELAKLKMLRLRTNSPLKRKMRGQLLDVLRMKLAEGPGIKTALKSERLDKMRSGLDLDSSLSGCIPFVGGVTFGKV
jgi:hypothetical protein